MLGAAFGGESMATGLNMPAITLRCPRSPYVHKMLALIYVDAQSPNIKAVFIKVSEDT